MIDEPELSRDQAYLVHSLHNRAAQHQAHIWTRGRGAVLYDQHGREFLDGLAGLWNVIVGHGRTELAEAASRQMGELAYASSYAGSSNRPSIELGERLAQMCYPSINRFFFTSGGAEANESAFKTARFYWKAAGQPGKTKIIGRQWGYHGTTLAAMSATGIASYWPMFEPRVPGFLHIDSPYPYRFQPPADSPPGEGMIPGHPDRRTPGELAADLLEGAILREGADTIAAFLGEPVQGAGGVIVPPDDYWPRIRRICDRYDVLLIADEVITGFGRTASPHGWFALSQWNVEPDLLTFAKGVTSGYFPFGGLGISDKIASVLDAAVGPQAWMHAFTYSGHPAGCAVALANLDLLERDGLRQRAAELGQRLLAKLRDLEAHPHVGEVRGLGLMAAVEFVADKATKAEFPADLAVGPRVHAAAQQRGLFTRLRGDVFNLAPCYVTENSRIDRMVGILMESVEAVLGK
ncbi:MAG: aspartate aminotransferase family protein [Pirellulales bacterium]